VAELHGKKCIERPAGLVLTHVRKGDNYYFFAFFRVLAGVTSA
jgi:hypothetical protein